MKHQIPAMGVHCRVTSAGEVIPHPGYEGPYMQDAGYWGKARFLVPGSRGKDVPQVVCLPSNMTEEELAVIEYNPVINFAYFDWSYWHSVDAEWKEALRDGVFGTNGPAAMPNNFYHIDTGTTEDPPLTGNGLVDPWDNFIKTSAYTMLDPANNFGWKITNLYFFRWKGQPGNPIHYPYGVDNVKVGGLATVRFEIWKTTYTDFDIGAPGYSFAFAFHEFKDYDIDTAGGTTADGVPSAITFGGFTDPQIDTFAQVAITDTWPQVLHASNRVHIHYWIKAVSFSVIPP